MALCNTVKIDYHGETLALVDPTEVKAVEPYLHTQRRTQSIFTKFRDLFWFHILGKPYPSQGSYAETERWTKIMFRDGTWIRVKIPFYDFVNGYC